MTGSDRVKNDITYQNRLKIFNDGLTTTHWPFESRMNAFNTPRRKGYKTQAHNYKHTPIEMTPEI